MQPNNQAEAPTPPRGFAPPQQHDPQQHNPYQQPRNQQPPAVATVGVERTIAGLGHWIPAPVALLFGLLLPILPVFLCFIAPLIVMLVARTPFVREHGRAALNFQLTAAIPALVFGILAMTVPYCWILSLLLFVACLVFEILGAVRAGTGEWYRYPVAIPFVPR